MKFTVIIIVLLFSVITFATDFSEVDSCLQFVGVYKVALTGCTRFNNKIPYYEGEIYTGLEINFNSQSKALKMRYNLGDGAFLVHYITDGKLHAGDKANTGKSYIANCLPNQIVTKREGLLKDPLITTVTLTPAGLTLVESLDGDSFIRTCPMIRQGE